MGESQVAWRYVGAGLWLAGVPARDLTAAEAEDAGEARLEASGLYVRAEPARRGRPAGKGGATPPAEEE